MAAGEILERGLRSRVRWIEGNGKEERRERERVNGALFTLGIGA